MVYDQVVGKYYPRSVGVVDLGAGWKSRYGMRNRDIYSTILDLKYSIQA